MSPKGNFEERAIERFAQLPAWDVCLTHDGFPFFSKSHAQKIALIANFSIGSKVEKNSINFDLYKSTGRTQDVWIVTTESFRKSHASVVMDLVARVRGYAGFHVRGFIVAADSVLPSIYTLFEKRVSTSSTASSDEHRLFDAVAYEAFKRRASDIHITLYPELAEIKFRVKGELKHFMELPRRDAERMITSAYNTLSESGATTRGFNERINQDSVIERMFPEGLVRFRYSGLPIAPAGVDVTLRLIPVGVSSKRKTAADRGYSPDQVALMGRIFSRSSGMILIAGVTGSGKSTTLADQLEEIAEINPGLKIRSVEDPVEFRIPGVYQSQVIHNEDDKARGINPFLAMLKQIMRADPDIIMVGEIRDPDTANVSVQATRSGHLLISTIHADGAPVCFDRLAGMGVLRTDLSTVGLIAGLIYQKLVPILCDHCKVPHSEYAQGVDYDEKLLERVNDITTPDERKNIFFRSANGCEHCEYDGVTGREVVAEILRPTPAMSRAIAEGDSNGLWRLWRATINPHDPNDMTGRTAFEHAIHKMKRGMVSPRDVEKAFKYVNELPFEDYSDNGKAITKRSVRSLERQKCLPREGTR